jgi:surfactin synthase thioesterase subunit
MSGLRLFCFPYGGAGASGYRAWSRSLPSWVEIVPVQLPGRESRFRDSPHSRLEPLLAELVSTLDFASGPFAFFGHSLGGLVAFELARELRRRDQPAPRLLVASAYPAPQLRRDRPHITDLSDDGMVAALREHFDVTAGLLDDPLMLELALPLLRADLAIVEHYVYGAEPPLDVPIVAFGGIGDPEAAEAQVHGWQAQTTKAFSMQMFPGGHFFVSRETETVLRALTAALATVSPA